MPNPQLKSNGLGIQFCGLVILLGGTRGFFIFKGHLQSFFFPGLIAAVIIFAICLFWGGSLIRKSKI
jgi:hypothetical protein